MAAAMGQSAPSRPKQATPRLPCPGPPPVHRSIQKRCQEIDNILQRHRGHLAEASGTLREQRGSSIEENRRMAEMAAEARRDRERIRLEEEENSSHQPHNSSMHSSRGHSRGLGSIRGFADSHLQASPGGTVFGDMELAKWNPKPMTSGHVDTAGVFTDRAISVRRQEFLFGAAISAPSEVSQIVGSPHDSVLLAEMMSDRHAESSILHLSSTSTSLWAGRSRPHALERSYNWGGVTRGEHWEVRPRYDVKEAMTYLAQGSTAAQRSGMLSARLQAEGRRRLEVGGAACGETLKPQAVLSAR